MPKNAAASIAKHRIAKWASPASIDAKGRSPKADKSLFWMTGVCLALLVGPAHAVDSWQLVKEEICAVEKLGTELAIQASYFQFQRKDGFACASSVLKALSSSLTTNPESRLGSSRLLWALYAATIENEDPERDANFRSLTTAIRLAKDHPLRGEARLGQLRLSVVRGKAVEEVSGQLESVISDLGLLQDRRVLGNLYAAGSPHFRESLRWLHAVYAKTRTENTKPPLPLELRLRSIAGWGQESAMIGAASPQILHYLVANAWKSGRRLIVAEPGPIPTASKSLPEISGHLDYSLCASGDCQAQSIDVTKVSDQIIEKSQNLDITNAVSALRYSIGSTPIFQTTCNQTDPACSKEGAEETGRHYWISALSSVVGGAAWKDSFWKKVKGIDDRKSSISLSFGGKMDIPACADPSVCPISAVVSTKSIGEGEDQDVSRSIILVRPDGSETAVSGNELLTLDRSLGKHTIRLEIKRSRQESGSSSTPSNNSIITVTVWSGAKLRKDLVNSAKSALSQANVPLTKYLPQLLMGGALTLRPAVINEPPAYMGLGEALSQYSDPNPTNRWDRVYTPLYFLNILKTNVGPELLPDERRGIELATRMLSKVAKDNFGQYVDQQIKLLNDLLPALSVALIDGAINAIQKEQPLSGVMDPFVQSVLATSAAGGSSSDELILQAKALINKARINDNLLDAVLLLYQARERLQQAAENIALELELLTIEKAGIADL